jgi:hypothetical protein
MELTPVLFRTWLCTVRISVNSVIDRLRWFKSARGSILLLTTGLVPETIVTKFFFLRRTIFDFKELSNTAIFCEVDLATRLL